MNKFLYILNALWILAAFIGPSTQHDSSREVRANIGDSSAPWRQIFLGPTSAHSGNWARSEINLALDSLLQLANNSSGTSISQSDGHRFKYWALSSDSGDHYEFLMPEEANAVPAYADMLADVAYNELTRNGQQLESTAVRLGATVFIVNPGPSAHEDFNLSATLDYFEDAIMHKLETRDHHRKTYIVGYRGPSCTSDQVYKQQGTLLGACERTNAVNAQSFIVVHPAAGPGLAHGYVDKHCRNGNGIIRHNRCIPAGGRHKSFQFLLRG